jgi:hypothetical protein
MADPTTMKSRVRGLILFLAIVWSIALVFLLLEHGSQELVDWAFRSGTITADLGMPRASAEAAAKCTAAVRASAGSEQQVLEGESLRQARFIAWKMGYAFGFAIGLGQAGAIDEAQRKESLNALDPMSQSLGVPVPSPPALISSVTGLPEYGQLIEDDWSCTATFLDKRYGARVGHIYKLGALTGFAVVYRIACPQCGVLFTPQIRHHGKEAGLPEEAWQAITELPPDDPSVDERQKKAMALVEQVEQALSSGGG